MSTSGKLVELKQIQKMQYMKSTEEDKKKWIEMAQIYMDRPYIILTMENGEKIKIPFCEIVHSVHDLCTLQDDLYLNMFGGILWQYVLSGRLQYYAINVKHGAYSDANEIANNEVIQDIVGLLPNILKEGVAYSSHWDNDGYIKTVYPLFSEGKSQDFPLEVGFCHLGQIFWHLIEEGCFVRLCYDFPFLLFFSDKIGPWSHRVEIKLKELREAASNGRTSV